MSTFPAPGGWQDSSPGEAGFDEALVTQAIKFAESAETPWPRELTDALGADPRTREPPPWNKVLGPTQPRGAPNGLIIRGGMVAGRWGDTQRVDMSFSVAKSYLSLLAGLAVDQGLIRNVDDEVREYLSDDDGFASAQNRAITWRHLLQQTSEWEGTLFDKPDLVDRNRQVGVNADNSRKGTHRTLGTPGTFWEYNDVRVNQLSLCLLRLFRKPLEEVLREMIMDPIGASNSWSWRPYSNAFVNIDGETMPSVPGGSHWGGGIFMHTEDHARLGHLVLSKGRWHDKELVSESWFERLSEPCSLKPDYGFMWWLNTDCLQSPSAPEDSLFAIGAGRNMIWIAPSLNLVVVARWIEDSKTDELIARIVSAIQ